MTPRWAVGMRKLGPGLYLDRNKALHLDEQELCDDAGVPLTPRHARIVREAALAALRLELPEGTAIEVVEIDR